MKRLHWRLNSLLLFLGLSLTSLRPTAQVPVIPADVRPSPEIVLEARVIAIPVSEFSKLGMLFPESSDEAESPLGFAVVLPEDEAQALQKDPKSTSVHSLKLQGTPGNPLRFRVDSRVPVSAGTAGDAPAYFEVGMMFEVIPNLFPSRKVALSSSSRVQVRRGPGSQGGLAPIVFETQAIKHDIQIPEGKTILLGGFLAASNSAGLPAVPKVSGNPLLGYVASKSPRKGDEPEIVVLLTPRVIGSVEPATPPPVTSIPTPVLPVPVAETPVVAPISASNTAPRQDIPAAPPPVVSTVPVARPPVNAAPPVPRSQARYYTVQVGAFGSNVKAEALVVELKGKFEGVFIDQASSGTTPYRVRVGRLSSLAAAKLIRSRLTAQGFDASYIVPPNSP